MWRINRRRLEAEAIRDSLMAMGGELDLTMGGSLLTFKDREYVTAAVTAAENRDKTDYDINRRAVYLPVIRSSLYDVFQAFDFGDPSVMDGNRPTTTVAPQALFMMNGSIVLRETRKMAAWLLTQQEMDDAERVQLAYNQVFGRLPAKKETARALDFLRRGDMALGARESEPHERRLRAWQSLCRVLVASNEFIYVE